VGDSFCKSKNSSKPYFREISNTQTTSWTTLTSWPNYVRTATGYTYQVKVGVMVWGSAYWQLFAPMAEQKLLSTNKVPISVEVKTDYIAIKLNNISITPADKLTEADVNNRVDTYAVGYLDSLIYEKSGSTKFSPALYSSIASNYRTQANGIAISYFKEGHYWGLYLYLTGHWRAVEVPVGWYSLSANTSGTTTLKGSYDDTVIIPKPNPETEIALTDFSYIEAVYAQLKNEYPSLPISTIQDKLIDLLRTDGNNAAIKVIALYDSYVKVGTPKAEIVNLISRDYNLNIKD